MFEVVVILILVLVVRNKGLKLFLPHIKEFSIKPLFKDWSVYPFIALFIVYTIVQFSIFGGNYKIAHLRDLLKAAYYLTVLIMVLRHKIYKPAIIGGLCALIGGLLNIVVMRANGGKMPVYPTLTLRTGYVKSVQSLNDGIHVLGTASTKLKFLTDWIDDGLNVMSPGDILFRLLAVIALYYVVKSLNEDAENKKGSY
jgi:hypothetical protein